MSARTHVALRAHSSPRARSSASSSRSIGSSITRAAWHYTLDEPGARVVAARLEVDFSDFPFKKARIFDVVASPRLRHRVECNGVFARLALACRRPGVAVHLDRGTPGRPPVERRGQA